MSKDYRLQIMFKGTQVSYLYRIWDIMEDFEERDEAVELLLEIFDETVEKARLVRISTDSIIEEWKPLT